MSALTEEQKKYLMQRAKRYLADEAQDTNVRETLKKEGWDSDALAFVFENENQLKAGQTLQSTEKTNNVLFPPASVDVLAVPSVDDLLEDFIDSLKALSLSVGDARVVAEVVAGAVRFSVRPLTHSGAVAPRAEYYEEQERVLREREVGEQIQQEYVQRGMADRETLISQTVRFVHTVYRRIQDRYAKTQRQGLFSFGDRELNAIIHDLYEGIQEALAARKPIISR